MLPKDPFKREEWLNKQRARTASEETKRKMSIARTGQKRSLETKERMSKARLGFKLTDQAKQKISIFNKGKKLSNEHIDKISNSLKDKYKIESHHMIGKKLSEKTIKLLSEYHTKINPMRGKEHTDETKLKISVANKGRFIGEKSPTWKGGLTKFTLTVRHCTKYKAWRKSIFIRDNFDCNICNSHGKVLEVHHILPFSLILFNNNIKNIEDANNCESLWKEDNGITLCKSCHRKIHKKED